jgi:hypothetical protein
MDSELDGAATARSDFNVRGRILMSGKPFHLAGAHEFAVIRDRIQGLLPMLATAAVLAFFLPMPADAQTNSSQRHALFVNASTSTNKTSVIRIVNTSGSSGNLSATAYDEAGNQIGAANAAIGSLASYQSLTLTSAQIESALAFAPAAPTAKYSVVFSATIPNFEMINTTRDGATGDLTLSQALTQDRSGGKAANVTRQAWFLSASTSANKTNVLRIVNTSAQDGVLSAQAYDEAGSRLGAVVPGGGWTALGTIKAHQMLTYTSAQIEAALGIAALAPTAKYRVAFSATAPSLELVNFTRDLATGNLALVQAQLDDRANSTASTSTRNVLIVFPSLNPSRASILRLVNPNSSSATFSATAYNDSGSVVGSGSLGTAKANQTLTFTSQQLEVMLGYAPVASAKYRLVINAEVPSFEVINDIRDAATGNLYLAQPQTDSRSAGTDTTTSRNVLMIYPSSSPFKTTQLQVVNTTGQSSPLTALAYDDNGTLVASNASLGTLGANQTLSFTSAQLEGLVGYKPATYDSKWRMVLGASLANFEVVNYAKDVASGNLVLAQAQTEGVAPAAFNMSQTLSDGAQRTTLAFSGLAMMSGNLEAQTFFPPGKVADYTGFQYLRDNDPDNMGHNTSFLTRVANNVLYILTDAQLAKLKALASAQLDQIATYGYQRYPLMKAFRRQLEGDTPSGSSGLNLNAVKKASRTMYLIDGQISFDRALLYADIFRSFDSTQKAYLDAMKGKGWNSWPDIKDEQVRSKMSGMAQGTAVAVMTYASDLYSWYAGSVEADVYFCPERHGTYYGGFYIKDAPAIGHEGYSIDEQLTATAGAALSDASKGYVTQPQAEAMSSLVATQKDNLYASPVANIVKLRTDIAALLRSLLTSTASAESVKSQVLALSATYGELDGANNHAYASVFSQVYKTLSTEQKTKIAALRKSIMSGTYANGTPFDYSVATTNFLYSEPITNISVLTPYIGNTDYLFFEP